MMERSYRLLSREGAMVSEVAAETLNDAADAATNMGYQVIDTVDPDVVVVADPESGPVINLVVWADGTGSCGGNGLVSKAQAAGILRRIADYLETGEPPADGHPLWAMPGMN